ncbi:phosphotransferase enzyme family protein [Echinimonas agarilytica]|uniref:Phosphotransferase n=1 Tax=Echinimonas agarilytica TaxID=1215918 RepID=A0AA41W6D6_9GAMM|nr:phosphotransferase [Echinimonas agarilytica]MCM2679685.1 phosphotransferase [Echinimonas agarilytica]
MATPILKRLEDVLQHYGLEPQANIEICATSGVNEIFFVQTQRGKIALKHHIQNNSMSRLHQEAEFALKLHQNGCPTPRVIANKNGQPVTEYRRSELYIASEFIKGNTFPEGERITDEHIRNLSLGLATFHQVGQDFALNSTSQQICSYNLSGLTNKLMTYRCELHTLEQSNACANAMLNLMHSAMPMAMGLSRMLTPELIKKCQKTNILGSFHRSNFLCDDDAKLVACLGLDDARKDLRIYDLFQFALYCVEQGHGQRESRASREDGWRHCLKLIIGTYSERQPLTKEELECLPALVQVHFLQRLAEHQFDVTDRGFDLVMVKLQKTMAYLDSDTQALTDICFEILSAEYA